jgi:hypothetical protein
MIDGKIYKVFVSSTYEDLRAERSAVQLGLLKLNCLPIGMELFPAADEETWDFIKSQIDDADYYVVVVAGKYGSVAPDGVSYTEKEYRYAVEKGKPAIGFIHGKPGEIAAAQVEVEPERRAKLDAFLKKIKERPVRTFTNPHELASEVITSFVSLISTRPAEGYVRSNAAVDYKRYADLLEENRALKEQLKVAGTASAFKHTAWGNVRVASNPPLIRLFEESGPDHDKFMAFLAGHYLTCWGRQMNREYPDLVFVGTDVWSTSYVSLEPSPDGSGTETYIRNRNRNVHGAAFRDLHLNFALLQNIWPDMRLKQTTDTA